MGNQQIIKEKPGITSFHLHIIAMLFMLLDHLWATVLSDYTWMTCAGRIAFPIFAFMTVEAYFHTHNLRKHILRLAIFAFISEIPFNLMISGHWTYWIHQNVLFTFLIANFFIWLNEKVKDKKIWIKILVGFTTMIAGSIVGTITMVDYYNIGIPTVLLFYFCRKKNVINLLLQIIGMFILNVNIAMGQEFAVQLFGFHFYISQQGFALLSLIPIWLYNGKQGPYNKTIKEIYYWFYPVHALILGLLNFL